MEFENPYTEEETNKFIKIAKLQERFRREGIWSKLERVTKLVLGRAQLHNHKVLPKPMPKFPVEFLYRGKLRVWNGKKLEPICL